MSLSEPPGPCEGHGLRARESSIFIGSEPGDEAIADDGNNEQDNGQAQQENPDQHNGEEDGPANAATNEQNEGESEKLSQDSGSGPGSNDENQNITKEAASCRNCSRASRRFLTRIFHKDTLIRQKTHKIEKLKKENDRLRNYIVLLEKYIRMLLRVQSNNDGHRWTRYGNLSRNFGRVQLDALRRSTSEENNSVWRRSNKENNISVVLKYVHPNVKLVAPDDEYDECAAQQHCEPVTGDKASEQSPRFERFNDLPLDIQLRIFRAMLNFEGHLIHVWSRHDPFNEATGLSAKFFVSDVSTGQACVSISKATDPAQLLRPLLTCKRWCFYLCHVFYGENTFAFSSFGELMRFADGVGPARIQRLQHLELYWKGGLQRTRLEGSFERPRYHNRSRFPLMWLREALRLRTLVVFLQESSSEVLRRPYEPDELKRDMKKNTSGQPNARMTRSMRSLFGLDYVLTLRGLSWCRWYDSDKMLETKNREESKIRDASFALDVSNSVTMEKVPTQAKKARLYRLDKLFGPGGWKPQPHDFKALYEMYGNSKGGSRLNDLDIDCDEEKGSSAPGSGESSSDDDDNETLSSDSDSGSDSDNESDRGTGADNGGLLSPPLSVNSPRNHPVIPPPSGFRSPISVESDDCDDDDDEVGEEEQSGGGISFQDCLNATKFERICDFVNETQPDQDPSHLVSHFGVLNLPQLSQSEGGGGTVSPPPDTLSEALDRWRKFAAGIADEGHVDNDDDNAIMETSSAAPRHSQAIDLTGDEDDGRPDRQRSGGLFVTPGPRLQTNTPQRFLPPPPRILKRQRTTCSAESDLSESRKRQMRSFTNNGAENGHEWSQGGAQKEE